jgi:hypothetical protein
MPGPFCRTTITPLAPPRPTWKLPTHVFPVTQVNSTTNPSEWTEVYVRLKSTGGEPVTYRRLLG